MWGLGSKGLRVWGLAVRVRGLYHYIRASIAERFQGLWPSRVEDVDV